MAKDEYAHASISMRMSRWKMLEAITARIAGESVGFAKRNRSRAVEILVEEKHERMKVAK